MLAGSQSQELKYEVEVSTR